MWHSPCVVQQINLKQLGICVSHVELALILFMRMMTPNCAEKHILRNETFKDTVPQHSKTARFELAFIYVHAN